MVNKTKSENELQKEVIEKLKDNGWKYIEINNIDDIRQNLKKVLEERNKKELQKYNKKSLTDSEFNKFLDLMENNRNFSECASFLMDDDHSINLDNDDSIYLNIFNRKKWCENKFQFAQEVWNGKKQRHDLILFINGIPITNIELKKETMRIQNAYNQIKEYSRSLTSLFKFIQLFIISNKWNTRYCANNKKINSKFVFKYANIKNEPINNLFEFIDSFLDTCTFSKFISKYMINKKDSNTLIALRSYQIHASEAVYNHLNSSNENGYIWHATGSGKTITSFKIAQNMAQEKKFEKIVFLVDRKDLDSQTIKEYNSFLDSTNKITETKNTKILYKQLIDNNKNNLIISTIQKMNRLIKNKDNDKYDFKKFSNKKTLFIFDECHRSQKGDMHDRIKKQFKNKTFIGFTGTPIFNIENDIHEITTKGIFHNLLHSYKMQHAINDKNILGFQIDRYEILYPVKEQKFSKIIKNEKCVDIIINDILDNFKKRSIDYQYSSLLTVESINDLIAFYKRFKTLQTQRKKENSTYRKIEVGAVFSIPLNYDNKSSYQKKELQKIINDFNSITSRNESADEHQKYSSSLQYILKEEINIPKIKMCIVVDMMLTGFDAKKINTLYVAKELKEHGLIQAISRTNRIYDEEKNNGLIIGYVPDFKKKYDEAVKLYSGTNNPNSFSKDDYKLLINNASELFEKINNYNLDEFQYQLNNRKLTTKQIESYKNFMKKVHEFQDKYNVIRTLREYNDALIHEQFNNDLYKDIIKRARSIYSIIKNTDECLIDPKTKKPLNESLDDIEIPFELKGKDYIDYEYIVRLLNEVSEQTRIGEPSIAKQKISEFILEINRNEELWYLKDVAQSLLSGYENDNSINIFNTLRKIFDEIENEFKLKVRASNEEIEEQRYFFKLKNRFEEILMDKWVDTITDLSSVKKYKEKIEIKRNAKKEIVKTLKIILHKGKILNGED